MKKMKNTVLLILVISILMTVLCAVAFAEGEDPNLGVPSEKEYQIKLYSGLRGTFKGAYGSGDVYTVPVTNGKMVSFADFEKNINITDDRYYAKGIRLSGYDANDSVDYPNFSVTEDAEYSVIYAVKGDMVKYTVRYVTADTKTELATETVGYANKGFVVVGSKNIDGYLPQAYNLGLTIGDDESKNILTFEYSPIPPETEPQQGQPLQEPNANVEGDYNIEQIPQPAEFINLDEQEVPLANLDANKDRDWKALAKPLIIGGVILLIGLFALMILLDSKKKKEEKEV